MKYLKTFENFISTPLSKGAQIEYEKEKIEIEERDNEIEIKEMQEEYEKSETDKKDLKKKK